MIHPERLPRLALKSFKVFQVTAHKNYIYEPATEYTKVKIIRGRQLHHTVVFVPNQNEKQLGLKVHDDVIIPNLYLWVLTSL